MPLPGFRSITPNLTQLCPKCVHAEINNVRCCRPLRSAAPADAGEQPRLIRHRRDRHRSGSSQDLCRRPTVTGINSHAASCRPARPVSKVRGPGGSPPLARAKDGHEYPSTRDTSNCSRLPPGVRRSLRRVRCCHPARHAIRVRQLACRCEECKAVVAVRRIGRGNAKGSRDAADATNAARSANKATHGTMRAARRCRALLSGSGCEICSAAIPHGTASGYTNWSCRAAPAPRLGSHTTACRASTARCVASAPAARTTARCAASVGTRSRTAEIGGYTAYGCRCESCREIGKAASTAYRSSVGEIHCSAITARKCIDGDDGGKCAAPIPHGTSAGYAGWHCNCRPCMDAGLAASRA